MHNMAEDLIAASSLYNLMMVIAMYDTYVIPK